MIELNIVDHEIKFDDWTESNDSYDFWKMKFFNSSQWPTNNVNIQYDIPDNIPFNLGEYLFRDMVIMERMTNIKAKFTISRKTLDNRILFANKEQFLEKYLYLNKGKK